MSEFEPYVSPREQNSHCVTQRKLPPFWLLGWAATFPVCFGAWIVGFWFDISLGGIFPRVGVCTLFSSAFVCRASLPWWAKAMQIAATFCIHYFVLVVAVLATLVLMVALRHEVPL